MERDILAFLLFPSRIGFLVTCAGRLGTFPSCGLPSRPSSPQSARSVGGVEHRPIRASRTSPRLFGAVISPSGIPPAVEVPASSCLEHGSSPLLPAPGPIESQRPPALPAVVAAPWRSSPRDPAATRDVPAAEEARSPSVSCGPTPPRRRVRSRAEATEPALPRPPAALSCGTAGTSHIPRRGLHPCRSFSAGTARCTLGTLAL